MPKNLVVPKLILFDVDQTLLSTMGGDRRALNLAFHELYGIPDAFQGIVFTSRMDLVIMAEAFTRWGVDGAQRPATMASFKEAYFRHLEAVLQGWTQGRVYPGVEALLGRLSGQAGVHLGLATGNFKESAFIKLKRYGLDRPFNEGGFGGDFPDRSQVVALAVERCQLSTGVRFDKEEVYVVGDSPSDIMAGQANGVKTVAVATGHSSMETLASYGPTHLLPDLSDMEGVLARLLGT